MDFLQISIQELNDLWNVIDNNRVLFHPIIAPDGQIDRVSLRALHCKQNDCIIIVDNNILIDLIRISREGCLKDQGRTKFMASLMLWVEINRLSVSSGQALQEKAAFLDTAVLSNEFSSFQHLWSDYTPGQWQSLYRGEIDSLPITTQSISVDTDMSIYTDKPDVFYYTYASVLKIVSLMRDAKLSRFERTKEFVHWSCDNTAIGKYVLAYGILLLMGREEGIQAPKKANSSNIEEVLKGCVNQAWDLESLSSWSQLLDMKEKGILSETFIFATMDKMLKKLITAGLWGFDLLPFLQRAFSRTELQEILSITSQLQSQERKNRLNHLMDRDHLCRLAADEENKLRSMVGSN